MLGVGQALVGPASAGNGTGSQAVTGGGKAPLLAAGHAALASLAHQLRPPGNLLDCTLCYAAIE